MSEPISPKNQPAALPPPPPGYQPQPVDQPLVADQPHQRSNWKLPAIAGGIIVAVLAIFLLARESGSSTVTNSVGTKVTVANSQLETAQQELDAYVKQYYPIGSTDPVSQMQAAISFYCQSRNPDQAAEFAVATKLYEKAWKDLGPTTVDLPETFLYATKQNCPS